MSLLSGRLIHKYNWSHSDTLRVFDSVNLTHFLVLSDSGRNHDPTKSPAQALLRIDAEVMSAHLGVLDSIEAAISGGFICYHKFRDQIPFYIEVSQAKMINLMACKLPHLEHIFWPSCPMGGQKLRVDFRAFYHITLKHPSDMIWLRIIRICGKKLHRRLANSTFKIRSSIQWS